MHKLLALISLLVFTVVSTSVVMADIPQQSGGVNASTIDKLNLRSGPGTQWRLMGTLEAGVQVRLDGRDGRAEWVMVDFILAPVSVPDLTVGEELLSAHSARTFSSSSICAIWKPSPTVCRLSSTPCQ